MIKIQKSLLMLFLSAIYSRILAAVDPNANAAAQVAEAMNDLSAGVSREGRYQIEEEGDMITIHFDPVWVEGVISLIGDFVADYIGLLKKYQGKVENLFG